MFTNSARGQHHWITDIARRSRIRLPQSLSRWARRRTSRESPPAEQRSRWPPFSWPSGRPTSPGQWRYVGRSGRRISGSQRHSADSKHSERQNHGGRCNDGELPSPAERRVSRCVRWTTSNSRPDRSHRIGGCLSGELQESDKSASSNSEFVSDVEECSQSIARRPSKRT